MAEGVCADEDEEESYSITDLKGTVSDVMVARVAAALLGHCTCAVVDAVKLRQVERNLRSETGKRKTADCSFMPTMV